MSPADAIFPKMIQGEMNLGVIARFGKWIDNFR